jgi:hypothetical protein
MRRPIKAHDCFNARSGMRRRSIGLAGFLVALIGWVSPVLAQGTDFKVVSGAFQDEYDYRIGEELNPKVDIDGLRWVLFKLAPKKEGRVPRDKDVDVIIYLGFQNTTDAKKSAEVILMLEDENGNKVGERIPLKQVKIGKNDDKIFDQKVEIAGSALIEVRKIYVLCEVE